MKRQGIVQVGSNWWKGHRMILVESAARNIPAALSGEILIRSQRQSVSVELDLFTGENPRQLTVLLILRTESSYYYEVLDRLDSFSQILAQHLTQQGFSIRAIEDQDSACVPLFRLFGGSESRTAAGIGFFPAERREGPGGYYIPGRYQADLGKQFDLARLAAILVSYPYAFFAIQLTPTTLTQQEKEAVLYNKSWYAQRAAGDAAANTALGFYMQWESIMAQPVFFVSMFCVGRRDFAKDMEDQMALWQMQSHSLSQAILQKTGYPDQGERELAYATAKHGHRMDMTKALVHLRRLTHMASIRDITSALPLPRSGESVPGLAVGGAHPFAGKIPAKLTGSDGLFLGVQDGTGISIRMPAKDLVRHGFIVGKPGSGKTTFALGLLYQLQSGNMKYPFLAIEPAKCEYRSLLSVIPDLRVYTPGKTGVSPISLNPFLPPKGVTLEEYLPNLDTIFGIAIAMDHPLDVIFPQVIRACYRQYGWRPNSTRETPGVQIFGMSEFIRSFRDYIRRSYAQDAEARANLESGGVVRVQALTRSQPVLFDTNQSMDFEELLLHPTVIELDAIDNNDQKALILAILMMQFMLIIRKRGHYDGKLKNVIMIDEAHLLLGQDTAAQEGAPNPSAAGIRLLQNMTLILRAYGTALLFGDQSPAKLTEEIMNNVNLKMMFRLDSQRDRSILADTALMSGEALSDIVSLPAGKGFLYVDALSEPICIVTPNSKEDLKLEDGIKDERIVQVMRPVLSPPFAQCAYCEACGKGCDSSIRSDARFMAETLAESEEVETLLKQQDQTPLLEYLADTLPAYVEQNIAARPEAAKNAARLTDCVKAQFLRLLREDGSCALSDDALIGATWPKKRQMENSLKFSQLIEKTQSSDE